MKLWTNTEHDTINTHNICWQSFGQKKPNGFQKFEYKYGGTPNSSFGIMSGGTERQMGKGAPTCLL